MATSSVDLTIDGRDDEDPDFNEESGSSSESNTTPPKKRGRGRPRKNKPVKEKQPAQRVSQNDLIDQMVGTKLTSNQRKVFKQKVGEIYGRKLEILEEETRVYEDAITSYITDPRVRATKVRQINKDENLQSLDVHGIGEKLKIPFDRMSEDASSALQGFDSLQGDTERSISEEDIFEYFKKGKTKPEKKFSETNIREAIEELAQEESEVFSTFESEIKKRIEELKSIKAEIKDSEYSVPELGKLISEMTAEERQDAYDSFLISNDELSTGQADPDRDESRLLGFSSPLDDEETFNKFADTYDIKSSASKEDSPKNNSKDSPINSNSSPSQGRSSGPTGSGGDNGGNDPPEFPPFPEDEEFGSDDDKQATREDLKKQREKELNKQLNKDFSDLRKEENRKAAQNKSEKDREFKQRRRLIRDEAKIAKSQISKGKEEDTTDRIVRRLAAFDLGRSLGGSGSLFAAASEKFVFRPSEDKDAKDRDSLAAKLAEEEGQKLSQLEDDIFAERTKAAKSKFDINKLIDDAKFQADKETDPEKKRKIFNELKSKLSGNVLEATLVKDSPSGSSDPKSSSTPQPSSTDPIQTSPPVTPPSTPPPPPTTPPPPPPPRKNPSSNTSLVGPINPNLPPVPPPPGPPPKSPGPTGPQNPKPGPNVRPAPKPGPKPSPSMAAIGNVYLGAAAAVQVFSAVMDGATETVKGFGSVLGSDQTRPSSSEAVGAAGRVAKIGGQTAGAVGGAAVGAALGSAFPVVGTVAGGLVGSAVGGSIGGKALEPVIEAITAGNALLEKQVEGSLGPMTIIARTQSQIDGLFKKIENDFELDELTAEFATARGELGLAIQDLQASFISEFGPYLIDLVELLTKVVETMPLIVQANKRIFEAIMLLVDIARNPLNLLTNMGEISKKLDFIVNGTTETAENTKKTNDEDVSNSINQQLVNFFGAAPAIP